MRWLDDQKRIFGKIHWVDLIVLIAGILVAGKTVWSFWPAVSPRRGVPMRIELSVAGIRNSVADTIHAGQWLKDGKSGVFLGTIMEKRAVAHSIAHWEGRRIVHVLSRDFSDLTLTLRLKAAYREGEGYFAGSLPLRAGRKGMFCTKLAEFSGEITRITAGDAERKK